MKPRVRLQVSMQSGQVVSAHITYGYHATPAAAEWASSVLDYLFGPLPERAAE